MLEQLRRHYYAQPHEVSIETLALCNARCTFCPYGSLGREGTLLSDEVLDRLIAEMALWSRPFFISPFKVSDPLLDRRMPRLCGRIEREIPQAKIRFFTNGSALTEHNRDWIGGLRRLDGLWVSLNSCDAQEYEQLMGLKYEIIARRLDELHQAMVKGGFPHGVTVSRVAEGLLACGPDGGVSDEASDVDFLHHVKARWPRFRPFLIKRDGWLGAVTPSNPGIPQRGCERWFELSITATGHAALCCMDGKAEHCLGRVPDQTLLQIYNQPYLRIRRLSAIKREGIEPCARCTY